MDNHAHGRRRRHNYYKLIFDKTKTEGVQNMQSFSSSIKSAPTSQVSFGTNVMKSETSSVATKKMLSATSVLEEEKKLQSEFEDKLIAAGDESNPFNSSQIQINKIDERDESFLDDSFGHAIGLRSSLKKKKS